MELSDTPQNKGLLEELGSSFSIGARHRKYFTMSILLLFVGGLVGDAFILINNGEALNPVNIKTGLAFITSDSYKGEEKFLGWPGYRIRINQFKLFFTRKLEKQPNQRLVPKFL